MTKEDLKIAMLNWKTEVLFASENGKQMYMQVDPFNNHINWHVKYGGGYYAEFYEDFDKACDFLLGAHYAKE